MRPYRATFLIGFVAAICATSLSMTAPLVLKSAVDHLAAGGGLASARGHALAFLLVVAVSCLFRYVDRHNIASAARRAEHDLRGALFAHLQRLDLAYFQHHRVGDLMSRATNDLNAVRLMIGPTMAFVSTEVIKVVVGLALMSSIDLRVTLAAVAPLPVVFILSRFLGPKLHSRLAAMQAQFGEVSSVLHESLTSMRLARAYGREDFQVSRFVAANQEYLRRSRSLVTSQSIYPSSVALLVGLGSVLTLYLGARRIGEGELSIGELVALQTYMTMLALPAMSFGWCHSLVQRGLVSWQRILQLLDAKPAVDEPAAPVAMPIVQLGSVEIRDLSFAFGDRVVLRDISVVLPRGSTTAIVGASGSGKSTLLALIARLYDVPEGGTVLMGGADVRRLSLATLRRAIGFVSQEPFLFGATIAENITFGARAVGADRKRIEQAAEIACLDDDIARLPHGYDTVIGERGVTLSGGQRQRVAIARAVICDPQLLILDDAVSAVDAQTEEEILRRLRSSMHRRTLIVVSHRMSVVRAADQILVLDGGRLVERGAHAALVRVNGIYAALARQQRLGTGLAKE
jgi:ATP-binding cassette subfamily B protein